MTSVVVQQDLTLPISVPSKRFAYWHLCDEVAFAFGRCIWCHVFFAVTLFWWHVKVISAEQGAFVNFLRKWFWAWGIHWIVSMLLVWKLLLPPPPLPSPYLFLILVSFSMKLAGVKWNQRKSFCIVVLKCFLKKKKSKYILTGKW